MVLLHLELPISATLVIPSLTKLEASLTDYAHKF